MITIKIVPMAVTRPTVIGLLVKKTNLNAATGSASANYGNAVRRINKFYYHSLFELANNLLELSIKLRTNFFFHLFQMAMMIVTTIQTKITVKEIVLLLAHVNPMNLNAKVTTNAFPMDGGIFI